MYDVHKIVVVVNSSPLRLENTCNVTFYGPPPPLGMLGRHFFFHDAAASSVLAVCDIDTT